MVESPSAYRADKEMAINCCSNCTPIQKLFVGKPK